MFFLKRLPDWSARRGQSPHPRFCRDLADSGASSLLFCLLTCLLNILTDVLSLKLYTIAGEGVSEAGHIIQPKRPLLHHAGQDLSARRRRSHGH